MKIKKQKPMTIEESQNFIGYQFDFIKKTWNPQFRTQIKKKSVRKVKK